MPRVGGAHVSQAKLSVATTKPVSTQRGISRVEARKRQVFSLVQDRSGKKIQTQRHTTKRGKERKYEGYAKLPSSLLMVSAARSIVG